MPSTFPDVCFIPLRKNKEILAYTEVSGRWFVTLNESKWYEDNGYASGYVGGKKWKLQVYIYKILLKIELPKGNIVDHKNSKSWIFQIGI